MTSPTLGNTDNEFESMLDRAEILRNRLRRVLVALAIGDEVAAHELGRAAELTPAHDSAVLLRCVSEMSAEAAACRKLAAALGQWRADRRPQPLAARVRVEPQDHRADQQPRREDIVQNGVALALDTFDGGVE